MSFSDARWLWALWGLPLLALLELWALRRARLRRTALVGDRVGHALLVQRDPRSGWIGAGLRVAAFACLVFGAAGPEWGREMVRRTGSGSDVVLVVDVSASMDARDVPPSRIDEARREALGVIDRLQGSRVAVVAFAGDAVRLCPLTLDLSAARLVVEGLSSSAMSMPGTDVGRALKAAVKVLPAGRRDEQAIVLWTDGEDLEQGARAALEDVVRAGVRVFAVGVGTREGDVVPVLDGEGHVKDIKRDDRAIAVRSRLDESLLRTLSQRTRGAYFAANRPGGELGRLLGAVQGLAREGHTQRLRERPVPRFPIFAAIAALLLAVERVRNRRRARLRAESAAALHSERATAAAAVLAALLFLPVDARAQSAWARGDRAFKRGQFAVAESLYTLRLKRGGPDAARINRETARAFAGHPDQADRELERLAARAGPLAGTAAYNLGTLRGLRHDDEAALAALRQVLERNPNDADARWNYEVLLRRRDRSPDEQPPKPDNQGGGGGSGSPKPSPSQPQPQPQSPPSPQPSPQGPPPPVPTPGKNAGMTREQADRLLNALEEMARSEQQQRRSVHAVQERRGRDW